MTKAGGITSRWTEPRSDDDRRIVAERIDDYLGDAGIPPPPPGAMWVLRLPDGADADELWSRLNSHGADRYPSAPTAADERDRLAEALQEWLR